MKAKEGLRNFLDQQIRMKQIYDLKEKELEDKMGLYQVQQETEKLQKNEYDKLTKRGMMMEDAKKVNNIQI